jgi:hypothetical protein
MTSEADDEGVHKSHLARDGGRALGQEVIAAHGGAPPSTSRRVPVP